MGAVKSHHDASAFFLRNFHLISRLIVSQECEMQLIHRLGFLLVNCLKSMAFRVLLHPMGIFVICCSINFEC